MSLDLRKLDLVPRQLAEMPVWLLWKSIPQGKDKPRKVPFYVDGETRGDTDTPEDRARLVTLDQARAAYTPSYAGVGSALGRDPDTDTLVSGIDCDECLSGGIVDPRVEKVIGVSESYTEVSPSGNGIKIFGTGAIGTTKKPQLEIYSQGRWFAVTGEKIHGERLADLTAAAALARDLLLPEETRSKPNYAGTIPDGSRNNALWDYACMLRGRGMEGDELWSALQARNLDCDPPGDLDKLRGIFERAMKYPPGFACTDLGNRDRLVAHHGQDVRYLAEAGWHVWTGHRFEPDRRSRVVAIMADVARGIYAEAAQARDSDRRKQLSKWAGQSEGNSRIKAAVELAQSHRDVVDLPELYDQQPMLVGVRNGVLDLDRAELREGRREDRITRQMNVRYDAEARAPRFEQFVAQITAGDAELAAYLQRALGYTLTAATSEQVMFIAHGPGANGKSVLLNTMRHLFGDYARTIQPETLMASDRGKIPNDIARLRGARLVESFEADEGKRLSESLVKQMTGQDTMAARFLNKEFFEFTATFKLWLATNHRPVITGTDSAIWRRIHLVPFTVTIPAEKRDKHLAEKLAADAAGILNWLIEGCRHWTERGLAPPEKVLAATEQYRADMDRLGLFLKEACVVGAGRTKKTELYAAYCSWCAASNERPMRKAQFHEKTVNEHSLRLVKRDGYEHYDNVLVVEDRREEPEDRDEGEL